jgi:hypothetical protein
MIARRAARPGPRTVALLPTRPFLAAVLLGLAVVVGGCGSSVRASRPAEASTGVVRSPSGSPGVVGPVIVPSDGASGGPDASIPRWPGTTVLAVIALGAADGEIEKAGNDLQAAADRQDLRAMWGAADGLANMIDALMPSIDRLEVYEGTRPVAALYRKAFPELSVGAKQLRDAITNGDAAGVVAGSQAIAKALADYSPIREQIAALVEQAIVQQRLLVR